MFPTAHRVIYDLVDEPSDLTFEDLRVVGELRGLDSASAERLIELFLYYGVVGLRDRTGAVSYIYDTQYDMEILQALIRKQGTNPTFQVNAAFWPALKIRSETDAKQSRLPISEGNIG